MRIVGRATVGVGPRRKAAREPILPALAARLEPPPQEMMLSPLAGPSRVWLPCSQCGDTVLYFRASNAHLREKATPRLFTPEGTISRLGQALRRAHPNIVTKSLTASTHGLQGDR